MNTQNIGLLMAHVGNLPESRFSMLYPYGYDFGPLCLAAHAVWLLARREWDAYIGEERSRLPCHRYDLNARAAELLGLDRRQAKALFRLDLPDFPARADWLSRCTRRDTARCLARLLEERRVSWDHACWYRETLAEVAA